MEPLRGSAYSFFAIKKKFDIEGLNNPSRAMLSDITESVLAQDNFFVLMEMFCISTIQFGSR